MSTTTTKKVTKRSIRESVCEKAVADLRQKLSEIDKTNKDLMDQYCHLMDIKAQLDVELDIYHHMLEGEESRLNMANSVQDPNTSSSFWF
uniref:IF rod domain-containing protein n=1 Tax=Strongyloides papillosus TaxID=174720 RepID=A0A0N5BAB5_STREA